MKSFKTLFSIHLLLTGFLALPTYAGDLSAGEQKAVLCVSCHGPQGKSSNPQRPHLAGQKSGYLVIQLKAFKTGERINPIMQSVTANLSYEDIENMAIYFSNQQPPSAGGNPELAKLGQPKAGMCMGCHGSSGQGNGQFPRLAGQHPAYLLAQLKSFKEHSRKNGQMQAIVSNLSENDMKELAAYFGSLN